MSNLASPNLPIYELYAIRYAARDAVRSEHFIGGDPHDGPMPMDYFVWLAKSDDHIVVIDTGFTANKMFTSYRIAGGIANGIKLINGKIG